MYSQLIVLLRAVSMSGAHVAELGLEGNLITDAGAETLVSYYLFIYVINSIFCFLQIQ